MANNCYITNCNTAIQNDNILKYGEFRYTTTKNLVYLPISFSVSETIAVIDGNLTLDGNTSATVSANSDWPRMALNGIGVISVPDRYHVNMLKGGKANFDLSLLDYDPALKTLSYELNDNSESIDFLKGLKNNNALKHLEIITESYELSGDISVLTTLGIKDSVEDVNIEKQSAITLGGDFRYLGTLKNCTSYGKFCHNTQIQGTVEDFVAEKRAAGKSTGSCTFVYLHVGGLITFNGTTLPAIKDHTISWTATTITCDGTTIDA